MPALTLNYAYNNHRQPFYLTHADVEEVAAQARIQLTDTVKLAACTTKLLRRSMESKNEKVESKNEKELAAVLEQARTHSRGYASYYGWRIDRDIEELEIVRTLCESLHESGNPLFDSIKLRGRGADPPDCEALSPEGKRVAIEVTELVCGDAIKTYKQGHMYRWANWPKDRLLSSLTKLIANKGARHPKLKDAPYEGGYIIVIHTDEGDLPITTVRQFLSGASFERPRGVTHAFLLLSYDPATQSCPYQELVLKTCS